MTPDTVRGLAAAGETFTVEFKRSTDGSLNYTDIVEAVACLSNGDGGLLLLGVENDGRISGATGPRGTPVDPSAIRAVILNMTEPAVSTAVEVVPIEGCGDVVVIDIPQAPSPVGTKQGVFKRRALSYDGRPQCVPYLAHEIISAGLVATGRDYAQAPARGVTFGDLDAREFERYRQMCSTAKGDPSLIDASDWDILRALRLLVPGTTDLTIGAVLLFGARPTLEAYVPTAEVLFQERRGESLVVNQQIRSPLFNAAEQLQVLLEARNTEQEILVGLHRIAIPRLAERVIREVVANALVHRDYSELGPVRVQLSDDDLRVTSPGGFPPGITLDNLLDESRPRSVILADAFKRAGIVDRNGRGVRDMYLALLRNGRSGPDYSTTTDRSVTAIVPTSDGDLDLVRFVIDHDQQSREALTLNQLRILHELKASHDATAREISEMLRVPEIPTREELARLGEMGLVEQRGGGRGRHYYLTAAFYRTTDRMAYVRMQDTDPIQQEHMILTYVNTYGSITRSKAAELCRLTPQQARTVLKHLTDLGMLALVGERRGAKYTKPAAPVDPID